MTQNKSIYFKYFKRLLDIILSLFAILCFSPLLIYVAFLVRKKLGTPVLFKQKRPGKIDPETGKERIFELYKFRSMTDERDQNGELLPDSVRLTDFGKKLRSTSIDELPELLNILKGDMSVVGPRPLAVVYLKYYTKNEHHRHDVRPGLTGLAQVNGRNSLSWEAKFKYDLDYINNISFFNDMKIIFLTVKKVFIREGIGQAEEAPVSLHILRADWLDKDGNIKPEYENK